MRTVIFVALSCVAVLAPMKAPAPTGQVVMLCTWDPNPAGLKSTITLDLANKTLVQEDIIPGNPGGSTVTHGTVTRNYG
jgi:hypothetical protein